VADGGTTSCRETNERIRREKTGEGRITHHGVHLSRSLSKKYAIDDGKLFGKDPPRNGKNWTLMEAQAFVTHSSEFFSNVFIIIASIQTTLSPSHKS
jgi:hypothetical protein